MQNEKKSSLDQKATKSSSISTSSNYCHHSEEDVKHYEDFNHLMNYQPKLLHTLKQNIAFDYISNLSMKDKRYFHKLLLDKNITYRDTELFIPYFGLSSGHISTYYLLGYKKK